MSNSAQLGRESAQNQLTQSFQKSFHDTFRVQGCLRVWKNRYDSNRALLADGSFSAYRDENDPSGLPAMRYIVSLVLCFIPALARAAEPPDLGSRKSGVDWPKLLGPTGDSVSPEKGILTDWPRTGLRVLWKADLGLGYAPPTISRGRIFTFDAYPDAGKKANVARLSCRESETGKELWHFDYPIKYDDTFGYRSE